MTGLLTNVRKSLTNGNKKSPEEESGMTNTLQGSHKNYEELLKYKK